MKKPESICIFGDSVSWGAWDLDKGGWVQRLWLDIGAREGYVEIFNLSISGGTTNKILERFESETKTRKANGLIFQTGLNDSSYARKTGNFRVDAEQFRQNVAEIIIRAQRITNKTMFIGSSNCDESRTTPVSWADVCYTNENITKYSKIMEAVCRENHIPFLNVGALDNEDFYDGLHPNAVGHQKIFEQAKAFLVGNAWI